MIISLSTRRTVESDCELTARESFDVLLYADADETCCEW